MPRDKSRIFRLFLIFRTVFVRKQRRFAEVVDGVSRCRRSFSSFTVPSRFAPTAQLSIRPILQYLAERLFLWREIGSVL